MSIIFGYLSLTGKPVDRGTLETMEHAMDFWSPDGRGVWLEGSCGLGNLLLYNTPEALFEKLPMTDATGNLVLTAGARIDNREELFRIFGVSLGARLTMPDSLLMLKAYEKWGEACADHLVGDWAFAIWDRRLQKLFVARDHHGITAMYYYKGIDFFVFSSSLKGILCLPSVPKKVNEFKIAQLLVNWNEGGPETCYLDIMRLPPAHTLTVQGGKLTTNRYWYLENTPEVRLKNDQEYIDMFRDLYTEAVRCRLRSHRPVGATLSSGLDSGSVCILAAQELAKEGKRLQAYTSVPLYDITGLVPKNRIGDEGPYAQALADKLGNVDVMLCKAENIGPLEGIDMKMKIHDQPLFSAQNAYWIVDILTKCQNRDVGTLLIGQGGNLTISWPPISLLSNKANILNVQKLRFFKQKLKFLLGVWKSDFLINEELLESFKISKLMKQEKCRPYYLADFTVEDIRMQAIMPGKNTTGETWFENGIYNKLEVKDPTIDLFLLKFLFGINSGSELYKTRKMFEENFKDYLNVDLINGKRKGKQSIDIKERIKSDSEKIDLEISKVLDQDLKKYFSQKKINNLYLKQNDKIKLLQIHTIKMFLRSIPFEL